MKYHSEAVECIMNEEERVLTGLKQWGIDDQPKSKQNEMARSRDVTNSVTLEQKENEDDKFVAVIRRRPKREKRSGNEPPSEKQKKEQNTNRKLSL